MNNTIDQQDDTNELIAALGITHCTPELQSAITTKFGELLFKRLLLLLPDTTGVEVISEITALPLERGMQKLIEELDVQVEGAVSKRKAIVEELIAEFRKSQ